MKQKYNMENKKPLFSECWSNIQKNFNWERLHKAMLSSDWTCSFGMDEQGEDRRGVPSIDTIQNEAYNMLKNTYYESKGYKGYNSIDGFFAYWEDNKLYLRFVFEMASSDNLKKI